MAPSACSPEKSPMTSPCISWRVSRSLLPVLGVLVGVDQSVTAAGGYLIQLLPGAGEEIISKIEPGSSAWGRSRRFWSRGWTPRAAPGGPV